MGSHPRTLDGSAHPLTPNPNPSEAIYNCLGFGILIFFLKYSPIFRPEIVWCNFVLVGILKCVLLSTHTITHTPEQHKN